MLFVDSLLSSSSSSETSLILSDSLLSSSSSSETSLILSERSLADSKIVDLYLSRDGHVSDLLPATMAMA